LLLAPGWACGAERDASPKPLPPALVSEIRRGADAALGCQFDRSAGPMDSAGFVQCVRGQQQTNRQHVAGGDEAFDAGLWYTARGRLRGLVAVAPNEPAKSRLDVASASLAVAEQASRMTDSDLWRALHAGDVVGRPSDASQTRHRGGHLEPATREARGGIR
jgi:hypothetical protein